MPAAFQQFSANEQTSITFTCTASGFPAPSLSFLREGVPLNNTKEVGLGSIGLPLANRVQAGMEEEEEEEEEEIVLSMEGLSVVTRNLTLFYAEDEDTGNFSCIASVNIPGVGLVSDSVTFHLTVLSKSYLT